MVLSFQENKKGHGFCAHGLSVTPYVYSSIDCLKRTGGGHVWKGKEERGPKGSIKRYSQFVQCLHCLSFSQNLVYSFIRNVKKVACQLFSFFLWSTHNVYSQKAEFRVHPLLP